MGAGDAESRPGMAARAEPARAEAPRVAVDSFRNSRRLVIGAWGGGSATGCSVGRDL